VSNEDRPVRLELTPEQKTVVRNATGQEAEALELSVDELSERVAPARLLRPSGGTANVDP
jgi:hypothetical protein